MGCENKIASLDSDDKNDETAKAVRCTATASLLVNAPNKRAKDMSTSDVNAPSQFNSGSFNWAKPALDSKISFSGDTASALEKGKFLRANDKVLATYYGDNTQVGFPVVVETNCQWCTGDKRIGSMCASGDAIHKPYSDGKVEDLVAVTQTVPWSPGFVGGLAKGDEASSYSKSAGIFYAPLQPADQDFGQSQMKFVATFLNNKFSCTKYAECTDGNSDAHSSSGNHSKHSLTYDDKGLKHSYKPYTNAENHTLWLNDPTNALEHSYADPYNSTKFYNLSNGVIEASAVKTDLRTQGLPCHFRATKYPTPSPTKKPTKNPTKEPTKNPTKKITKSPTKSPTPGIVPCAGRLAKLREAGITFDSDEVAILCVSNGVYEKSLPQTNAQDFKLKYEACAWCHGPGKGNCVPKTEASALAGQVTCQTTPYCIRGGNVWPFKTTIETCTAPTFDENSGTRSGGKIDCREGTKMDVGGTEIIGDGEPPSSTQTGIMGLNDFTLTNNIWKETCKDGVVESEKDVNKKIEDLIQKILFKK